MTNMSLPLTEEKSEAASFINGSLQARQRAAAVFSVPSASNNTQTKAEGLDTEMFRDIARTTLPIDFRGEEVKLEAHAYEDDTVSYQAMALVHRDKGSDGGGRSHRARAQRLCHR